MGARINEENNQLIKKWSKEVGNSIREEECEMMKKKNRAEGDEDRDKKKSCSRGEWR